MCAEINLTICWAVNISAGGTVAAWKKWNTSMQLMVAVNMKQSQIKYWAGNVVPFWQAASIQLSIEITAAVTFNLQHLGFQLAVCCRSYWILDYAVTNILINFNCYQCFGIIMKYTRQGRPGPVSLSWYSCLFSSSSLVLCSGYLSADGRQESYSDRKMVLQALTQRFTGNWYLMLLAFDSTRTCSTYLWKQ